jgi:branched-chain amino acid transport system permease protein
MNKKNEGLIVLGTTLLVLFILPFVISVPVANEIIIYMLFALGFNILLGHTGLISFGHAAYFGVGAYFAGIALRYLGTSVWTSLAVSFLAGGLAAALIGAMAIKKKGVYFAMISLAFGQMFYFLALSPLKKWTGGEDGLKFIPVLKLDFPFHVDLASPLPLYFFTYFIVALAFIAIWRFLDSPLGRVLRAIRENEDRIQACGYDTTMAKLASLIFSGAFSGLAGGLLTVYLGYVPVTTLYWMTSGTVVMMTILGGMHSFIGPAVGAWVYLFLQDTVSRFTPRWEVWVGTMFMALILLFPGGIVGTLKERLAAVSRKTKRIDGYVS